MREAVDIQVFGVVQGVGFRPFVYRLAKRYLICGWVLNTADGVSIHAEGERTHLDEFIAEIADNAPPAAVVERITFDDVPLQDCSTFEIRFSQNTPVKKTTFVSPDLGTCDDCLRELFDPSDRRYRYPFINCTNCGPRFTIIDRLPYDRPHTSMAEFFMCTACAEEYADPLDRRFHAQPDACFSCGPHISWQELGQSVVWGTTRAQSDEIFARAVRALRAGKILAVKGLGGFHLVCDAANAETIARLRARKQRDNKAFAVMVASVASARRVCQVSSAEEALLTSPVRPIVLLRKHAHAPVTAGLADNLLELGVMLPATPVQHLLIHDFCAAGAGEMLVMTSGNLHDEPIVTDDVEAVEKLGTIADAILGNNRAILSRYDDSVVRVLNLNDVEASATGDGDSNATSADADTNGGVHDAIQFLRRARGFAPAPLIDPAAKEKSSSSTPLAPANTTPLIPTTSPTTPCLFATGPEQKNTFAFMRGDETFVSQHIGDMENAETYDAWLDSKQRFQTLFQLKPERIACDLHPEYLTSKWAHDQTAPVIEVQHHHAHIASVLGEQKITDPVCGFAFDGTGYGVDGALWGGEVLLANRANFERFANFTYVPMPGGAAAIRHPLRMAFGVLWAFDLLDHPAAQATLALLGKQAAVCEQMIERSINTPQTSSVGRLFDAASALLGICTVPTYEGEAAILLDAARDLHGTHNHAPHDPHNPKDPALHSVHDRALHEPLDHTPHAPLDYAPYDPQDQAARERYAIRIIKNAALPTSTARDTSVVLLDPAPTFSALLDDMHNQVSLACIARRFHSALVDAIVTVAEMIRALYGIETVVLSGGSFMNRFLVEQSTVRLTAAGFTVALNKSLPPNDGCISFGQAVVASAKST